MINYDEREAVGALRPAPRWRVHVEIRGGGAEMTQFRGFLDERLMSLPPWRSTVITADIHLVALTFSAFGSEHGEAMADARTVLKEFGVPDGLGMVIELTSPEQIDRQRRSDLPLLLGVKEVARVTGYTRQRVSQLAREQGPGFPRPIAWVEATPLWLGDEVDEWSAEHDRTGTRALGARRA